MYSTTMPSITMSTVILDDERREPMGLTDRERCRSCRGPVSRTDASGLCWSCMPTG
jgi:hypothetical protein